MNIFKNIFGNKDNPSKEEIRNYLKEDLNSEESREFEEAISDNPLLGDAIDGYKEFGHGELDNIPSLEEFYQNKNIQNNTAKVRSIGPIVNRIAAGLLGVVAISAVYLYWGDTSYDRIYSDNFNEFYDPDIYNYRTSDTADKKDFHPIKEKAISKFNEGDYEASIHFWEQYNEVDDKDVQTIMYLGYSHLRLGNPEKAIEYLNTIAKKDTNYKDETMWYLALAQIKLKNKDEARSTLDYIIGNSDEFYVKKAKNILKKM